MTFSEPTKSHPIRSFVLRQGRITQAQQYALDALWPRFGIDPNESFDNEMLFPRRTPLILEIGFGNGESLVQMAAAMPEKNFLGIEVHRPGVGHLLLRLQEMDLTNVRVCCADAVEVLTTRIADRSLAGIQIFFPIPGTRSVITKGGSSIGSLCTWLPELHCGRLFPCCDGLERLRTAHAGSSGKLRNPA